MADVINASYITACALQGCERAAFWSMMRASSDWSRLPQLTPMRTGLSYCAATSIIWANWLSRLAPWPTLPGLMRYFDNARAHSGKSRSKVWPL